MKKILTKTFKYLAVIYLAITCIIGSFVIAWPFIILFWNAYFQPAPVAIKLENGFVVNNNWESKFSGVIILNQDNNKIITSDVKKFQIHKNFIYGFRKGLANEVYYFVCEYGADCTESQTMNENEFKKIISEKNLPEFNYKFAKSYDQLLKNKK